METIEVLKNVQRIALECMIGKKPVHINVGVMPDHKEWNKKTYDRFMSVISDMTCVRLAG